MQIVKSSALFILISGVLSTLSMAAPAHDVKNKNDLDMMSDAVAQTLPEETHVVHSSHEIQLSSEASFDLSAIKRTIPGHMKASQLFQPKSWYTAPPPPPIPKIPVLPAPPSAPPVPFVFVGRMIDGDEVTLFLSKNDQHYAVKVNDILESVYQVGAISDVDADLIYLPMKITQKLVFDSHSIGRSSVDSQSTISTNGISMLPANVAPPMAAPVSLPVLNH